MTRASRRLLGRGSVYTLGSAAPVLAGVLVTPLLTRTLDLEEYGRLAVAVVVMQWTVSLLALGLPVAITRHALTESSRGRGASGVAIIGSAVAVAAAAVVATCLGLGLRLAGEATGPAVVLALLGGGVTAGVAMVQAWALAVDKGWFYVALALGITLLAPAGGLLVVSFVQADASLYFTGVVAVDTVVLIIGLGVVRALDPPLFSWQDVRRCLRVGLPMVPHQFATGSAMGVAVMVAVLVQGSAAGGRAQIAVYVGTVMLIVTSAITYAWTPIILAAAEEQQGDQLGESATEVAWLAGLGGATVAALAPWLLRVLVPAGYGIDEMVGPAAAVSLTACLASAYLAHAQLVIASGRTGGFAVLSPLALVLGGGAAFVLTSAFGLVGIGLGYLITYVFLWLFTRALARRVSSVRWAERRLVLPIMVASTACLLGGALPVGQGWAGVTRLALALVLVGIAAARLRRVFAVDAGVPVRSA